ncbi:hypothetical protein Moror_9567 [Moniliophthora roreri MCA 2997]|uniref:Uncharacterized protein n=2 Tax=Moniliophthora roreri TaxID=221103 RepID=V2XBJ6_MONRO|nr:hypothetical protein Moror_9567 [Moniliophthora roreri MCA 2997]
MLDDDISRGKAPNYHRTTPKEIIPKMDAVFDPTIVESTIIPKRLLVLGCDDASDLEDASHGGRPLGEEGEIAIAVDASWTEPVLAVDKGELPTRDEAG